MNLQDQVIEALGACCGKGESLGYDSQALNERVRGLTDKIIIPTIPTSEFPDLLESGSDVSKFLKRCMETPHAGIRFFSFFNTGDEKDARKISALDLVTKVNSPQIIALCHSLLSGLNITAGEVHLAIKTIESWCMKKLSGYVAEYWKFVKNKKNIIQAGSIVRCEQIKTGVSGIEWTPSVETSLVGHDISSALCLAGKEVGSTFRHDVQFDLWKRADSFLRPSRPNTAPVGLGDERATKVIETGIQAGVEFAMGCMHVSLKKCGGDREKAIEMYQRSSAKLFTIPGMMNIDFIAAIPELLRQPILVQKMATLLKEKRFGELHETFSESHNRHHTRNVDINKSPNPADIIRKGMQYGQENAYNPDLFEVTNGELRVCQWFIDFVRLINSYINENYHSRLIQKGCPMMHIKTQDTSMLFMEDFTLFFAETMAKFWRIK